MPTENRSSSIADEIELHNLREQLQECADDRAALIGSLEGLRAQLAERDLLLVKANYVIDHARTIDKQAFARGTQNVDHGLFRGLGNLLAQYDEALSASAEPSAPVERDERAEFEVCIRREWPMAPISRKRDLLPKDDPCYGDYCDEPLQRAWVGWQMRASLERKPA